MFHFPSHQLTLIANTNWGFSVCVCARQSSQITQVNLFNIWKDPLREVLLFLLHMWEKLKGEWSICSTPQSQVFGIQRSGFEAELNYWVIGSSEMSVKTLALIAGTTSTSPWFAFNNGQSMSYGCCSIKRKPIVMEKIKIQKVGNLCSTNAIFFVFSLSSFSHTKLKILD